jgi:hypothetical protein
MANEDILLAIDKGITSIHNVVGVRDFGGIHKFNLQMNLLVNLQGIQIYRNIIELNVSANDINDMSAIAGLRSLQHANLSCNQLTVVTAVRTLPSLRSLKLAMNHITDIREFEYCKHVPLVALDLAVNQLNGWDQLVPLAGLRSLQNLNLRSDDDEPGNQVTKCQNLDQRLAALLPALQVIDSRALRFDVRSPFAPVGAVVDTAPIYHPAPLSAVDPGVKRKRVSRGTNTDTRHGGDQPTQRDEAMLQLRAEMDDLRKEVTAAREDAAQQATHAKEALAMVHALQKRSMALSVQCEAAAARAETAERDRRALEPQMAEQDARYRREVGQLRTEMNHLQRAKHTSETRGCELERALQAKSADMAAQQRELCQSKALVAVYEHAIESLLCDRTAANLQCYHDAALAEMTSLTIRRATAEHAATQRQLNGAVQKAEYLAQCLCVAQESLAATNHQCSMYYELFRSWIAAYADAGDAVADAWQAKQALLDTTSALPRAPVTSRSCQASVLSHSAATQCDDLHRVRISHSASQTVDWQHLLDEHLAAKDEEITSLTEDAVLKITQLRSERDHAARENAELRTTTRELTEALRSTTAQGAETKRRLQQVTALASDLAHRVGTLDAERAHHASDAARLAACLRTAEEERESVNNQLHVDGKKRQQLESELATIRLHIRAIS